MNFQVSFHQHHGGVESGKSGDMKIKEYKKKKKKGKKK